MNARTELGVIGVVEVQRADGRAVGEGSDNESDLNGVYAGS
jgi:hypothetical protein